MFSVSVVNTFSFNDQNPGTSGLRKRTAVFEEDNYAENFLQSILHYCVESNNLETLIVGGDGRYLCEEVAVKAILMAAANGVKRVVVGKNGLLSTPALSNLITKYGANGGIILTASHNPGGPNGDFGIKLNVSTGGSANEKITSRIFEISRSLTEFRICSGEVICLSNVCTKVYTVNFGSDTGEFCLEVVDPVESYIEMLQNIFDFDKLAEFIKYGFQENVPCKVKMDGLSGVTGPYVKCIAKMLGIDVSYLDNIEPLKDFGGKHPDPNLTYAADLLVAMKNSDFDIGAAFDGDGDRNMILGRSGFFVNPCDSVAIIAANAVECIPFFRNQGKLRGLSRSFPTSRALDCVASKLCTNIYVVPTGWKFFTNLMDAGILSICGEESFGTSSNHLREKDGIWALLAWLSILAEKKKSVEEIVYSHWKEFGRNFYVRHDFENLDVPVANRVYDGLQNFIENTSVGKDYGNGYLIKEMENFCYNDPIDGSISANQGLRILFANDSSFIIRKSGTGSVGLTLRIYFEFYTRDPEQFQTDPKDIIMELVEIAYKIMDIRNITGLESPHVVT